MKNGDVRGGGQRTSSRGPAVPAAARAMALFETFARERRPLAKSELARLLDLPESSTSDLLNTLHAGGYVVKMVSSRRYYPTGRLGMLTETIAASDPLLEFAREACDLLASRTGETSAFAVRDGRMLRVLAVGQGMHRLRYVLNVGDAYNLHSTALGKALLVQIVPDERARLLRMAALPKLTPNTIVDALMLEAHLGDQETAGHCSAVDEGTVGVSSIAVPGVVGDQHSALGLIGPTDRLSARGGELVDVVREVAASVFAPSRI